MMHPLPFTPHGADKTVAQSALPHAPVVPHVERRRWTTLLTRVRRTR